MRDQLEKASQPTAVRRVLHCWALLMDEHLTGWLPLTQAQRSAAQLLASNGAPAGVVEEALTSALVRVQGQRVGFRHEWYGHFMTAEALLWQHTEVDDLTLELGHSHRRALGTWVVPLLHDPEAIRRILEGLQDSDLLTEALQGRLGPIADQVVLAEARRCLQTAGEAMAASRIVYRDDFQYTLRPQQSWTRYEQGVFVAVGTTASDGRLLEPLARLLRATDQASYRGAEDDAALDRLHLPSLMAALLAGPVALAAADRLPADLLMDAARLGWVRRRDSGHPPIGASELRRWTESQEAQDVGLRMLLCLLLRSTDDPESAAVAPALFAGAWATGAHHVQFAALDVLTSVRMIADEATVTQINSLLNDVHTDDVWVSTMLVDALHAYGQISSPYDVADIRDEIASLIAHPEQPEARAHAARIVEAQFEDVIAAPFTEAIAILGPAERTALTILAVSGGDVGLFTQSHLVDLIRDKDPAAVPAFEYWASHLDPREPYRQGAIACFDRGIEGCATHLSSPPKMLTGHEGPVAEAWRCYGRILFWLHRAGASSDVLYERCAPEWEQLTGPLLDLAVDPLHMFDLAARSMFDIRESAIGRLVTTFPAQVRGILHHALAFPERLGSLFPYPDALGRTDTVISLLSQAGDHSSLSSLTAYRSHPSLGGAASDAIRRINDRQQRGVGAEDGSGAGPAWR
ncbi:hypothetical protein GXW82_23320 [Streptacidiphilus sp. 4-A2]|nr:hypothetical protein [Streptacidiphilus sp. 4-A2]